MKGSVKYTDSDLADIFLHFYWASNKISHQILLQELGSPRFVDKYFSLAKNRQMETVSDCFCNEKRLPAVSSEFSTCQDAQNDLVEPEVTEGLQILHECRTDCEELQKVLRTLVTGDKMAEEIDAIREEGPRLEGCSIDSRQQFLCT